MLNYSNLLKTLALSALLNTPLQAQTLKLGQVSLENSGSPQAQEAFLDGLAALHCFWYPKALEKFQAAEKIDPKFGLAYWGEAMTYNHPVWNQEDVDHGKAVLSKMGKTPEERQAMAKTDLEKKMISTLEIVYGDGSKENRDENYRQAWEAIYKQYPDQIEAVTFYALSLLGTLKFHEGSYDRPLQAAQVMEDYLKKGNPNALEHPGLLHYLIHAYDHPTYASRAMKFAQLYAKVSPDSSHALHMPSHIFLQLGMWDEVIEQNQMSYDTSKKWAKKPSENDFHSFYWLMYGFLQQGKFNAAKKNLQEMQKIAAGNLSDSVQGYYGMMRARYAVESGDWKSLETTQRPKGQTPALKDDPIEANLHAGCVGSESEHNRLSSVLAVGMGAAFGGHPQTTANAIASMEQLRKIYEKSNGTYDKKVIAIEEQSLQGLLEMAQGKEEGIQTLKKAAELEEAMDLPSGPPIPVKPATELYAENLLKKGDAKGALEWFKKSLVRTPKRTLSLEGAYRAAQKLGQKDAEAEYRASLEKNVAHSDQAVKDLYLK